MKKLVAVSIGVVALSVWGFAFAKSRPAGDAKVPGTKYHATGDLPCAAGPGAKMDDCAFGVVRRGSGSGTVTVTRADGAKRDIVFDKGKAVSSDGPSALTSEKSGDVTRVTIGPERYEIRDIVLFGD